MEAEAYAEGRDPPLRSAADELRRATRDLGPAGPGGNDDAIRVPVEGRVERRIVGPQDEQLGAEPVHRLREVEGERVVVVDEQHAGHGRTGLPSTSSIARRSAPALARVSASSAAGSESATIPAPAWIRQTPPAMSAVRIAMQVSSVPSNPRYPTAPPYGPRRSVSSAAMRSIALILRAP